MSQTQIIHRLQLEHISPEEEECLQVSIAELCRPDARDPKLAAATYFLDHHKTGNGPDKKTWLEHGCIIFSQYFDTAKLVASELAKSHPDIAIAVYAGTGKSGIFKGGAFATVEREYIKVALSVTKSNWWLPPMRPAKA